MSDELDPVLLRAFARSEQPFPDAAFVARVSGQLRPHASLTGMAETLVSAMEAAFRGFAIGLSAPLRLRYAGPVALAAALVAAWSLLPAI